MWIEIKKYYTSLSRIQKACLILVCFYFILALLSNIIANDKPLTCTCNGERKFPAFGDYLEQLGLKPATSAFDYKDCSDKIIPVIPFHAGTLDPGSNGYSRPSYLSGHFLGTDALGKDVLAGIIHGSKYVFIIGIFSVLFSFLPGVVLGMFMGYWQDYKLKINWLVFLLVVCLFFLLMYEWTVLFNSFRRYVILSFLLLVCFVFFSYVLITKYGKQGKLITIPIDSIGMRVIEVFESFPKILILIALTLVISRSTIWHLVFMIAFIRWPVFAQISRAETLRVSQLPYILSAQNIELPWYTILYKHILPNIKSSLLITCLFSFSAAILLEASLSFLGLGLHLNQVSWGSILNEGRQYFPGWWLSLFPGLSIFILIVSLNWLMDKKQ